MGVFSMCQHCGSDWCSGECITDPILVIAAELRQAAKERIASNLGGASVLNAWAGRLERAIKGSSK